MSPSLEAKMSTTERESLFKKYSDRIAVNPDLTRSIVSFQANKNVPFYRWLKYKEAFSSDFVTYVLRNVMGRASGNLSVLDPFAGAGTTLTTVASHGSRATGIELLPAGIQALKARLKGNSASRRSFEYYANKLKNLDFSLLNGASYRFPHIRITEKAFPNETEKHLSIYQSFLDSISNRDIRFLFRFACLSILEEISYTRKDGQYLRWDYRANKSKTKFNKGKILNFPVAINSKIQMMFEDIRSHQESTSKDRIRIIEGSCLSELEQLEDSSFDLILTSPPYCNRYDYSRTYALELAYLGYNATDVKTLRQTLLSATVENKSKDDALKKRYSRNGGNAFFQRVKETFEKQKALQESLSLLYYARDNNGLNNNNLPDMVRNYFFEMNFVIHEISRLLKKGGYVVLVNDNVQYAGEEIPVDLILSDFAVSAGLDVKNIWVLPRGKGNSSQQMGNHGRNEIRKCVYLWQK